MSNQRTITFQEALDIVESLPTHQQESLIDILQHRLIEHRRELLAKNILNKVIFSGEIFQGDIITE